MNKVGNRQGNGKRRMKIQFIFSSQTKTSFSHPKRPMLLTHMFFKANVNDFSHVDLEIHYQNGVF
jgi:hypothetical protein